LNPRPRAPKKRRPLHAPAPAADGGNRSVLTPSPRPRTWPHGCGRSDQSRTKPAPPNAESPLPMSPSNPLRLLGFGWWTARGSNPRPPDCEPVPEAAFSIVTGIVGTATVIGAFLTGWPVDRCHHPQLHQAQRNAWQLDRIALPLADSNRLVRSVLGSSSAGCWSSSRWASGSPPSGRRSASSPSGSSTESSADGCDSARGRRRTRETQPRWRPRGCERLAGALGCE
jgi:hypothetical protein